ncbi:Putative membrane protein [Halorhabdus tiamatea SARL4B]|uniref:Putative membrane protein n=1 Tax=Halorhabdus tiamatea SARL4B TaxID=1033806 RepID=U2E5B1_9EURY|nr:metal-dependent hydrolase [Halorhabdus tiamatea]ERJ07403.1 Putative membrane protein [Halorhabdus tiamatea SARL4B]
MYRKGHFGIMLATWSIVSLPLTTLGHPEMAFIGLFIMAWFEPIPDYDFRVPYFSHRGVSHTIWTPLFLGGVFGGFLWWFETKFALIEMGLSHTGWMAASPIHFAVMGGLFAMIGVFSHFAGDILTPMGLPILWPYSDERFSIELTTAKSPLGNALLLLLGIAMASGAFYHLYSALV